MPTEPAIIRPTPQRVYVAIYEHRHGTDVRVFADEDQAMCWRTDLAKEWWSDAFEDDPPPDDEIGEKSSFLFAHQHRVGRQRLDFCPHRGDTHQAGTLIHPSKKIIK